MANPFEYAKGRRNAIVKSNAKKIKNFYKEVLSEVRNDIETMRNINTSDRKKLKDLEKQINSYMNGVDSKTEKSITSSMDEMVLQVHNNLNMFLGGHGFEEFRNNENVRNHVVNRIITGKVYSGKWSLSSSIWGDNRRKQIEIQRVIAKGLSKDKNFFEIAQDLERYVNPDSRRDYFWSSQFPGIRRKVDYNAIRLSNTLIQHAFEESFVEMTKNNPFIEAYKWETSGMGNVCQLCMDRESVDHYGLGEGVYPKDSLPLDHPNGMCHFECVITMSENEIADAVADWYLGVGDKKMNKKIDRYIKDLKNF